MPAGCLALAGLVALLTPTSALAEFAKDPEIRPGKVRGSVVVGHSEYSGGDKVLVAAPRVYVDYRALEALKVWLDVPMSHVSWRYDEDNGQSSFQLANIAFGARYVTRVSPKLVIRTGGGLAVPSATVPDGDATGFMGWQSAPMSDRLLGLLSHIVTAESHGLWKYWLYEPDRLSIVSDTRLVFRAGKFRLTALLDIALSIYTGPAEREPDNVATIGVGLGMTAAFRNKVVEVGLGVRAMGLALNRETSNEKYQLSAAPFFRAFFSSGFIDVRWNLNLAGLAGFSLDDGDYWGLEIGLGAYL